MPAQRADSGPGADAIVAIATGSHAGEVNMTGIGALGAEMLADAILRAVREAAGEPNYPAARGRSQQ